LSEGSYETTYNTELNGDSSVYPGKTTDAQHKNGVSKKSHFDNDFMHLWQGLVPWSRSFSLIFTLAFVESRRMTQFSGVEPTVLLDGIGAQQISPAKLFTLRCHQNKIVKLG